MNVLKHHLAGFLAALALGISVVAGMPGSALAQPAEDASFPSEQEIASTLDRYTVNVDGVNLFDSAEAERDGVPQEILDVGAIYNQMISPGRVHEGSGYRSWNLLNRWRYCGPNNSGPGAPLNSADAVCKRHDDCLNAGMAYCQCDTQFVYGMRRVRNQYSGADRAYIEAAIQAVPRAHGCPVPRP